MNVAKSKHRSSETNEDLVTNFPGENPFSSSLDEMLELPAPTESFYECDFNSSEEDYNGDKEDDDYKGEAGQDNIKAIYKDWIDEMDRIDLQRMVMMLYDDYRNNFGLLKTSAARQVAAVFGLTNRTVITWRKQFLMDPDGFGDERKGKHLRYQLIKDEEFRDQALEWVRNNNNITGKKNMTANDFAS